MWYQHTACQRISDFDELLDSQDPDYEMSGVVQPSLIRLGFLGVLPPHRVLGCIGAVSSDRHARLLRNLASHLLAQVSQILNALGFLPFRSW
jgi:mRNA interferase MazF